MSDLRYEAPGSLAEAVKLFAGAEGTVRPLAGGTDLIVQLENDLIEPDFLVDIKRIPGLSLHQAENGGMRIGAAVSSMEIIEHPGLAGTWPGLIEGVKLIGSIQVKGRATMPGNLCNASPGADSVPPLVTAGAMRGWSGPKGPGSAGRADPGGPGKTSLAKARSSSPFPAGSAANRGMPISVLRRGPRWTSRWPALALNLTSTSGRVHAARVALGAVAPTVLLVEDAGKRARRYKGRRRGDREDGRAAARLAGQSTTSAERGNSGSR